MGSSWMRRGGVVAAVGCLVASVGVVDARADESIPVPIEQAIEVQSYDRDERAKAAGGGPMVLALNAVRRVGDVTVVYFSTAADPTAKVDSSLSYFVGVNPQGHFGGGTSLLGSGAVLDVKNRKMYRPLTKGTRCIGCSANDWYNESPGWTKAGQARAGWFSVPALPEGLDRVDVAVADQIFQDVPAGDGPLVPEIPRPKHGGKLALGTGWPTIDPNVIKESDNKDSQIVDLTATISELDDSRRERTDATTRNVDLDASVLFGKDSDVVRPAGKALVTKVGKELAARKVTGTVKVTGYTDNLGSEAHGLDLSRRRAAAVAKILTPLLPAGTKVVTEGKGEADPVASNDTEAGRKLNRRVTITVKGG